MATTKVEISVKTIFTLLIVFVVLFVLSRTTDILTQVFIAFIMMTALNPIVTKLQKLRMSRTMAIITTYIILIATIIVTFAAAVPAFIDQTSKLFTQLNLPSQPLLEKISHFQFSTSQILPLVSAYGGSFTKVVEVVFTTFSSLFTFFTILVMAVYFLLGRDHIYTYFTVFFRTSDKKERSRRMIDTIESALGSWVRGEFLLMLTIGIMSFIGLSILNIPYALPLAIFAGFMEALPNIGPTLSALPAVLVAMISVSPVMAGVTTILYILIQQIENNFVVPQVMKHATGIRPLTTIVLILMGFRFGGVLGALLSIPIYIVSREVLSQFSPEIDEITHGA